MSAFGTRSAHARKMKKRPSPVARAAAHGEKMIEIRVRFFAGNIAANDGYVIPKHSWDNGIVVMKRNDAHGIRPEEPTIFRSIVQLPAVIEKVLIQHGIVLHPNRRLGKLIQVSPKP